MSISSQISRISKNVTDSLAAVATKGVTVPSGSTSDDLPDLIAQIETGTGGGVVITDTTDAAGGTIRTITATEITGTLNITQNGVANVASYANVNVQVATGDDFPVFTVTWDSGGNITSVTCSKTYAECVACWNNRDYRATATFVIPTYTDMINGAYAYEYAGEGSTIYYAVDATGDPVADYIISYTSAGVLDFNPSGINTRTSSDLTASTLTVTAPAGYYPSAATKTLTDANLSAGNIKKNVSVFGVTGSLEAKTCPTFTVTMNNDFTSITSITCDMTYAQCYEYAYTNNNQEAIISCTNGSTTFPIGATCLGAANGSIFYGALYSSAAAWIELAYNSDGTFESMLDAIPDRDNTDLSVSGATVTVPHGVYYQDYTKSVDSMTLPASAAASATSGYTSKATISRSTSDQYINIPTGYNAAGAYYKVNAVANGTVTAPSTITGTSASVSTGTNTLTLTKTVSVTPSVTTAGYVSSGTAGNSSVSLTASVTTKAAATIYPSTSDQSISASQYLTGAQTIKGVVVSGLSADKILSGTTVKVGDSADDDRITSVSGSVTFQTYYTGSSAPSSNLGVNGDIYLKTT